MFRRRQSGLYPPSAKRSLFRGRSRGERIHLPAATLKRGSAIRPAPAARGAARTLPRHAPALPSTPRSRHLARGLTSALLACGIAFFWPAAMGTVEHSRNQIWGIDRADVKQALARHLATGFPEALPLASRGTGPARVHYNLDPELQAAVQAELDKYRPDYGVVVAMDAETGRVLAMADVRRDGAPAGTLPLKATYPAASVFKTVTAAAAIDLGKADASTVVPYNGKTTTLYRKNVLEHRDNKWTRHDSLAKSFAQSANVAFARLGIFTVGGDRLLDYATRFGFNHPLDSDLPLETSTIEMDPADPWSVAEAASGWTRGTNMSPLHGAALAAVVANGGMMPAPRLVDAITDPYGIILFESEPGEPRRVIAPSSAAEMRELMRATVAGGTAGDTFRGFARDFGHVEVGGKTGSLTGSNPEGRYDWFIGYASDGERTIAFATLCINKNFWYVKSSHLARRLVESYFAGSG